MKEIFANITADITIFDIIDILVVTFIIYKVLGFIRETRAQQLVKGILVLVAVFLLSDLLNLNTINWILRTTMTMGVIALVILFQPELRRALERMGRGGFFLNRFNGDKSQAKVVVDSIVDAVDSFSGSGTGALIVIEGEVSLGDIAENGTVLNAEISPELLGNIFYKGSPLHDGAVIIRDDKVFAAGCGLILTASLDIGKELGTRHRAAIGITENSDAVTIIVSEENGIISVARGGKLQRFLDSKGLEKLLLTLYIDENQEQKGILSLLKNPALENSVKKTGLFQGKDEKKEGEKNPDKAQDKEPAPVNMPEATVNNMKGGDEDA